MEVKEHHEHRIHKDHSSESSLRKILGKNLKGFYKKNTKKSKDGSSIYEVVSYTN